MAREAIAGLMLSVLCGGCDQFFSLDRGPGLDVNGCPASFAGGRYQLIGPLGRWPLGEQSCRALDTIENNMFVHLAVLTDYQEVSRIPFPDEAWVGLVRKGQSFVWITEELDPIPYIPWTANQPNSIAAPLCATLHMSGGGVDDAGCLGHEFPALCECDGFPEVPERLTPE